MNNDDNDDDDDEDDDIDDAFASNYTHLNISGSFTKLCYLIHYMYVKFFCYSKH